jgi:hypothetical protein
MQRLRDEFFVDVRTVAVGGVVEIQAQLVRAAQHCSALARSRGGPQMFGPQTRMARSRGD